MFDFNDNRPDYYSEPEADSSTPEAGNTINFSDTNGTSSSNPSDNPEVEPEPSPARRRWRKVLIWTIAVCIVGLAVAIWLRYFNPYAEDSMVEAYIVNVERRGVIFKTYEADIISEQALTDSSRLYTRTSSVTIPSADLAERLRQAQGTGQSVRLITSRYHGMLPWRGGSTTVVTDVK